MSTIQEDRLATLVALAQKRPKLGRTALMKLCYFLQTLRGVPLRYRFTLYSYGPFDSGVLSDLASAETLGGLRSEVVLYPGGYGYEIEPSGKAESLKALAVEFLKRHESSIEWVTQQFGIFGSADLELLSTIVYVDREFDTAGRHVPFGDLAQRVREVKPRFSESEVGGKVADLLSKGLLNSVDPSDAPTNLVVARGD
jgi:hypothetical protein